MTVDLRPKSTGETLQELATRLYRVEQESSRPSGAPGTSSGGAGTDPEFNTITIDGIVVGADASPVTGLTLGTGSFMDDIWIDADWTAPADGTASSYDVELARKVGSSYELVQVFHTGGTGLRMSSLWPQTTYGVRVIAINRIDARSAPTPAAGFQDVTTGIDATVPEQTSNFQLTAGIRTVMATWNEVADRDVALGTGTYEVQLATDSGFTSLFASKFTSATITSFSGVASSTTYWGRVRAVDNSGNAGAWSTSASVTTVPAGTGDIGTGAVQTTNIAALAVGNAQIANASIDDAKIASLSADKITAGTISADRIATNSLDVNKLTTSTLTSKTITIGAGGVLKVGNAPTTGILINDQGIRLYSGGAVKVALDVLGTATFEGNINASTIASSTLTSATINAGTITGATIRTAASGERIAFEAGVQDQLKFYTGHASENLPGKVSVGSGTSNLNVDLTAPRVSGQNYGSLQMATRTSNSDPAIVEASIRDPSGNVVQSLRVIASTASVPGYLYFGKGVKFELAEFPGSTAVIRLVGSGDYGFLYLQGGGIAATLNVNTGLGAGFHVMNSTNGSFQPIQASAFNVSSAASTKKNVRTEGEALGRLRSMRVVRFKRDYLDAMKTPPPHIERFYDLDEIGFLANELILTLPEAVVLDGNGNPSAINLAVITALLVKSVQEINELLPGRC